MLQDWVERRTDDICVALLGRMFAILFLFMSRTVYYFLVLEMVIRIKFQIS
jgi:hypothetical protein